MKPTDFFKLFDRTHDRRRKLMEAKTKDYASEDILSNFRRMAQLCATLNINVTKPAGCCLFLLTLKLDRICNVVRKGEGFANEGLGDSIADILNYTNLLHGVLNEKENIFRKIGIGQETVIGKYYKELKEKHLKNKGRRDEHWVF